ncbi:MAG: acyl-CoA dehydrogenase family protein [Acidimicrobiia bacterium]
MELDFTDEQEDLREAIRAVLVKESPVSLAREVVEQDTRPDAAWATFVALGWPSLTVPQSDGGVGRGPIEAAILAEELGRQITPGPLLSTVTQFVPAVREAATPAQRARWLGAVAAGECSGSLAIVEANGSFDPAATTVSLRRDGDEVVLEGDKRYVIEGDSVAELVVVARDATAADDGVRAVVVPVAAAQASRVHAFDGTRRLAHVRFEGARVPDERILGAGGSATPAIARAVEEATVALAMEMVGTAQAIYDVTLEYAKQRVQFGVPIGSFQATKHKIADILIALERARSTGYFAALTLAEDDERRTVAASVAKAAAGDCRRLLAKEGIQIHGGIGYTWEHDMHLYVKRIMSSEQLFGTSSWHRARLADALGM